MSCLCRCWSSTNVKPAIIGLLVNAALCTILTVLAWLHADQHHSSLYSPGELWYWRLDATLLYVLVNLITVMQLMLASHRPDSGNFFAALVLNGTLIIATAVKVALYTLCLFEVTDDAGVDKLDRQAHIGPLLYEGINLMVLSYFQKLIHNAFKFY